MTPLPISPLPCSQKLVTERSSVLSPGCAGSPLESLCSYPYSQSFVRSSWMRREHRERYASVKLIKNLIFIISFCGRTHNASRLLCICVCICGGVSVYVC